MAPWLVRRSCAARKVIYTTCTSELCSHSHFFVLFCSAPICLWRGLFSSFILSWTLFWTWTRVCASQTSNIFDCSTRPGSRKKVVDVHTVYWSDLHNTPGAWNCFFQGSLIYTPPRHKEGRAAPCGPYQEAAPWSIPAMYQRWRHRTRETCRYQACTERTKKFPPHHWVTLCLYLE